ncbi:hypothetical protein L202_00477 [Cryptococcus amylolentus CBS 6039]|uniref:Uncharacterized protein n=1 Tax=Cryptococcus amylolentus CBS 6039 TaxID=1295533 RepID=A0A1E3I7J4_9TREE|nr:hypothetical protein L202_00477 [Cryptococcus amylolentus CBS 6039]ODN84547.1 hypothetical protein L202_00477 [Cryptococcus amylolentus CBS 6039]
MKNQQLVKQHYDLGHKYMSKGDYEEAWKNFDKAINFGGKSLVILDCKAAAMSKLPEWRQNALQVTKEMVSKWPKDFKGYYRQASVLHTMKAYDPALVAVKKAVELGPTQAQNDRQFRAVQELRASITIAKSEKDRSKAANDKAEAAKQAAERHAARKARINYTHLLSRDIVLTIAESGMVENPNFVFRMAGVCRQWRDILVGQQGLWGTLVLGKKRMDKKTEVYIERSGGRIREIRISAILNSQLAGTISSLLRPHLSHVHRLIIISTGHTIRYLIHRWTGCLENLQHLQLENIDGIGQEESIVHGLVPPRATSLTHIEITGYQYASAICPGYHFDFLQTGLLKPSDKQNVLTNVKTLILRNCVFNSAGSRGVMHLEMLLGHFPNVETVELSDLRDLAMPAPDWEPYTPELPFLRSYSINNTYANIWANISTPALRDTSLPSHRLSPLSRFLQTPGLASALSSIRVLDISESPATDQDLLKALACLPALEFLNVTGCPLSNTFIEGLVRKTGDKKETVLPKLTALSIARNDQITGGPVLRLVRSRYPGENAGKAGGSQQAKSMGSAFKPAKSVFGRPTTRAPAPTPTPSSAPPKTSQVPEDLPRITWLNIDHCNLIEPSVISHLRERVRFVSNAFGQQINKDRIRGKGKWRWDMSGEMGACKRQKEPCGVRKVPGTKDQWYVYHTCEQEDKDAERGWVRDVVG